MHPQCSSGGADAPARRLPPDPQEEYETEQRYLLELLLEDSLGVLTYREALTARVEDPDDPIEAEAFGNAARALVADGLATRQGEVIFASRAARQMIDLGWHLG
jgi:hypothetical protein